MVKLIVVSLSMPEVIWHSKYSGQIEWAHMRWDVEVTSSISFQPSDDWGKFSVLMQHRSVCHLSNNLKKYSYEGWFCPLATCEESQIYTQNKSGPWSLPWGTPTEEETSTALQKKFWLKKYGAVFLMSAHFSFKFSVLKNRAVGIFYMLTRVPTCTYVLFTWPGCRLETSVVSQRTQ